MTYSDEPTQVQARVAYFSMEIDRVPKLGARAAYVKQALKERLIEHIVRYGKDMPEIRNWKWRAPGAAQ
jgi:xylulose-5-phosphate/fructose-6-phosphate phosphoketolase